ncbi:Tetratricopeptide repeat protein 28 [Stylophora pistillata]|uniref:Tetratricopeptide repeat protein 28 n=1 Tax=Stylophora pistillata TaxID=50429 RepID=A0A2B4R949_STYPI|nr:Tetratricopeptide repeat protein 28 [Stylophora pistillata]
MVKVPITIAVSYTVANFLLETGRVSGAMELYKECLIVLHNQRLTMDRSNVNNILRVIYKTMTNAYRAMNDHATEAKYLRRLLHLYQDSNESVEKGRIHFRLANSLHAQNKFVEARTFYELAISIMETNGDKRGEAVCYGNLGTLHHSIGEYENCSRHVSKALALSIKNGYRDGEAASYGTLGTLFQSLGKYDKAREYEEKALTIRKEIGDKQGEAASYGNLGTLFQSLASAFGRPVVKSEEREIDSDEGTKLGPILFLLMINDLAIETPLLSSHWKYVDDLTISEAIPSGGTSSLQKDLDAIAQWSSRNNMNLNPKKCKELVISSLRTRPDLGPLCVNGRPLERVSSHKVLGVTISDTLGWNEHVREIVSKASKRLYILRVLKRSGIPPEDLINIFYALVRSVLEYACVTWSTSLPIYLKDMIERVQKRALRILFPALSYKDAIVAANSTRLNVRRDELCKKVWGGICVPGSRLYHLIPPKRADCHVYELRNKNHVSLFKCRTERFKKSFFPTMASNAQFL